MKAARTVRDGGKSGDGFKGLPIVKCAYRKTGWRPYLPNNFKNFYSFFVPNVTGQFVRPVMDLMKGRNTETYLKMMEKYPNLKMITHPGDKMPIDIDPVAEMAARQDVILEINQHHEKLNVEDLIKASKYPVKFAVASDAHAVKDVGNTGNAEQIIQAAGVPLDRIVNVALV